MVKVVVNDSKGLVQYSGNGLSIEGGVSGNNVATGMEFIKYGSTQSLNTADDYDDEIELPANAVVTDVGVVFLTICTTANTAGADQIAMKVGTSAGGVDIVAATDIVERNKSAVAGSMQSVALGNKVETTANAIAFADAALLRSATGIARSIHTRLVVENATLAAAGTARTFVKYIIVGS